MRTAMSRFSPPAVLGLRLWRDGRERQTSRRVDVGCFLGTDQDPQKRNQPPPAPRPHEKMRSNSNAFTMESVSNLRGVRMLGPVCDAVVRSATKIRDIDFLQSQFLNAFVRWVQFDEGFRPTTWIGAPLRKTAARMLRTSDGRARIHKQSQSCSRMPSVKGLSRRD